MKSTEARSKLVNRMNILALAMCHDTGAAFGNSVALNPISRGYVEE